MESGQPNTIQPHRGESAPEAHVDNRPEANTKTLPGTQGSTLEEQKPLSLVGTPQMVSDMSMNILYSEDIDGMKDKVLVIDSYVKNEMGERELEPTVGNYRIVLDEIRARQNIDPSAGALTTTSLLYYYLKGKMNL